MLPGLSVEYVYARLAKADGKEIQSGKFASEESSAALAANVFGWFATRSHDLPPFPGIDAVGTPIQVDIEYCARFPWRGGRHPWLDAAVVTATHLVGIESKRFEPYRDRKTVSLSDAYDRPVWGTQMGPFEQMRDRLRSGEERFEFLDAAQLAKHAFGLVTQAAKRQLKPVLVYVYAEPAIRDGRQIDPAQFAQHRAEITHFANAVAGAEVAFTAVSYRDWLASWPSDGEVAIHGQNVLKRFAP